METKTTAPAALHGETDPSIVAFTVCEFFGTGDGFFGGTADDRPLGKGGQFLKGSYLHANVAEFSTRAEALDAASKATKRAGGRVSVIPVRDYKRFK